jgi:hypothetical protein
MRRVLQAIGVIVLVVLVLGAAGLGYLVHQGNRLDREAEAYSTGAVAAITARWQPAELQSRASPALAQSIGKDQLAELFGWFAGLGPLQDQPVCQGTSEVFVTGNSGPRITGRYRCTARYLAGDGTVDLTLVKSGGVWLINGFHVSSPVLAPPKPLQKA